MPLPPVRLHRGRFPALVGPLADRIAADRRNSMSRGGFEGVLASPVEVLLPSRSAADSLAAALLERFPEGLAGVTFHTPDALARRTLERAGVHLRLASDPEQMLAMEAAAREAGTTLRTVEQAGRLLHRTWRDLRDSNLRLADFRRVAPSKFADPSRARELAAIWARYEAMLAKGGAVEPSGILERAIALVDSGTAVPTQILFGFYDATALQEALFLTLGRVGALHEAWIPAPPDPAEGSPWAFASRFVLTMERLGDGGRGVESVDHPSPAPQAPWTLERHATRDREIREAMRRVRSSLDDGVPSGEIAIVTRSVDDALAALVEREARRFGFSVTPRRGRPLASHPWGRAIRNLLRLRTERYPRERVVELARAPFRRGVLPDGARAQALDEASRKAELPGGGPNEVLRRLPRIERQTPWLVDGLRLYAETVEALDRLCAPFDRALRGGEWARALGTLIESFRIEDESDLAALEALGAIAETLRKSDPWSVPLDALRIDSLILDAPDLPAAEPEAPLVWFGDIMSFRGRSARRLFAVSMQQEVFPQRRSEDLLLPNRDRRAIGMREIDDGRAEERLLFELMLDGGRDEVRFSWAQSDGLRASWRPSMFLKERALREASGDEARRIVTDFGLWVDDRQPPPAPARNAAEANAAAVLEREVAPAPRLVRQLRLAANAGATSSWDGYLQTSPALQLALRRKLDLTSPSRLEVFGECPQRFLYATLFGVEEIEEPERQIEIDRRAKGTLDHRILQRFYDRLPTADIAPQENDEELLPPLRERLRRIVDVAFEEHEAEDPASNPFLRELEKRLTFRFLEAFLARDLADLAAEGVRPRHFEFAFGPPREGRKEDHDAVVIDAGGEPLRMRGMIDRVDFSPEGDRIRVVDYKSGRAARRKDLEDRIRRGHALQLALYARAAAEIFAVPPGQMAGSIRPLRPEKGTEAKFRFELAEILPDLDLHLARFVRSMLAGRFPAHPGDHCGFCAVGRWCRARNDREQRWALDQWKSASMMLAALFESGEGEER